MLNVFQGFLPYKIRERKQMKEPQIGYEMQNTNLKHDLNVFVSFQRFHSAFSFICRNFLSMNGLVCVHECIFLVSNTWKDVPDDLHKVVFVSLHWSGGGSFTAHFKAAVASNATRWQCCNSLSPKEAACTLGTFVITSQGSSPFNTLLCYDEP